MPEEPRRAAVARREEELTGAPRRGRLPSFFGVCRRNRREDGPTYPVVTRQLSSVEFVVPDEMELVEFFGTEPVERQVEDGYWCYEISDNRGVTLRFSFDLFEQSVQTAISVDGAPLATVSHEGAQVMAITDQTLTCVFRPIVITRIGGS